MTSPLRLRIVSLLRDSLQSVLRLALTARHELCAVRTSDELDAALRAGRADLVVVDPEFVAGNAPHDLVAILDRHAAVHVVSYTVVSPDAMRAQMLLAEHGYRHLVLKGFDDSPSELRAYLENVPPNALSGILLTQLAPALDRLPPNVAKAIEKLFQAPGLISSVEALTRLAGLTHRRRLYEALSQAGWESGWTLLRAARVVRAYAYLARGQMRVREVALQLGYPTTRALAKEVRAVSGFLPSSLARQLEPQDFLARVASSLVRRIVAAPAVRPDVQTLTEEAVLRVSSDQLADAGDQA